MGDEERDGKGANRSLLSGKLKARDVICKEYLSSEEGVMEEVVCPGDCDAQLVSERCGARQGERDSREEG
jgi:hypothetical protein